MNNSDLVRTHDSFINCMEISDQAAVMFQGLVYALSVACKKFSSETLFLDTLFPLSESTKKNFSSTFIPLAISRGSS